VSHFSKTFVISTEMQQTVNKKVIRRWTREIICNTFDSMRITFPFEALTKISFLRIYFFNLFSENLNSPRHSFLRRLWEIWHWQHNFLIFFSLLFPPPNMKICTSIYFFQKIEITPKRLQIGIHNVNKSGLRI
jgi:hypothetical protein